MSLPFTPSSSTTVAPGLVQGFATILGTGHFLRFCNAGSGNAYVAFYEANATPPTMNQGTSMLIPAGAVEVFSVASDTTHVAFLGDATGTTLNITRGDGA